jgi:hypothetical protein
VGIFRKDPINDFLKDRSKRREKLTLNSEVFGHCYMKATPSAAGLLMDNYSDQNGKFYFMPDGLIDVWSQDSLDELHKMKPAIWGYGFAGNFLEYICFRVEMMGYTFVIQEVREGDPLQWLKKHYPNSERKTLSLF